MGAASKVQQADRQAGAAPSRVYGVVDVVRANRIAGWAIDRSDAGAALEVDILRDGAVMTTVRADRPRADLERNGLGTGLYGFSAEIAPPLEPGFEFTLVAIARAADGERAELKRVGGAAADGDPTRRLLEGLHLGLREVTRMLEGARSSQDIDRLADLAARLELTQARIEQALEVAQPPAGLPAGVKIAVAVSLAVGAGSLVLGALSFLQP